MRPATWFVGLWIETPSATWVASIPRSRSMGFALNWARLSLSCSNIELCAKLWRPFPRPREDFGSWWVAFVKLRETLEWSLQLKSEFTAHLAQKLPKYMVPSLLHPVEMFPLNTNGKIDRNALLAAFNTQESQKRAFEDDSVSETAKVLLHELGRLSGRPVLNADENFFELGGDSILAFAFISACRDKNLEFGFGDILRCPTLRRLATFLDTKQEVLCEILPPPLHDAERRDGHGDFSVFRPTDIQQAYWLGRQAGLDLGNISTHEYYELELGADVDIGRLTNAMRRLIERHEMLRAVVSASGELRILSSVSVPDYAILMTTDSPLQTRAKLSHAIFDPSTWPLFQIFMSHDARSSKRTLHFPFDWIILDAGSLHIFLSEWRQCYLNTGWTAPALLISFAECLAEDLPRRDKQMRAEAYWQAHLPLLGEAPRLPYRRTFHRSLSAGWLLFVRSCEGHPRYVALGDVLRLR
eukprot:m.922895 g.922895  ORF g.922895 m.922895 type:complete len:470 (+) comp103972_c0_seq1:989-2398(+)